jgi:glycopeptide antibiotics resistance protein
MHPFSPWFPVLTTALSVLVRRWSGKILFASVVLVLFCTLYPFNFALADGNPLSQVATGFTNRTSVQDLLANVVFFIPFGFGVTSALYSAKLKPLAKLAIVLIASAALSASVEMLQVFLPARTATYSDVLTNVLGGGLGWFCFQLAGAPLLKRTEKLRGALSRWEQSLPQKYLVAAFLGYMLMAFGAAAALQTGSLAHWSSEYPLILGNNQSGQRAWEGAISDLLIADRAISASEANRLLAGNNPPVFAPESLVAVYSLSGSAPYRDQTGVSPDLSWRGQPPTAPTAPTLSTRHWLETDGAAAKAIQRLKTSSEFTLVTTVTPATLNHNYFARFLSIAASPTEYNLILGQVGPLLLFWVQTTRPAQVTQMPNAFVGGIFAADVPRKLVFTYAGLSARLYTDASPVPYAFDLTSVTQRLGLLSVIFVPLGILLALITNRLQSRFLRLILVGLGVLVSPGLLEAVLVWQSGRSVSRSHLLLSALVLLSVLLLFHSRPRQVGVPSAHRKNN